MSISGTQKIALANGEDVSVNFDDYDVVCQKKTK